MGCGMGYGKGCSMGCGKGCGKGCSKGCGMGATDENFMGVFVPQGVQMTPICESRSHEWERCGLPLGHDGPHRYDDPLGGCRATTFVFAIYGVIIAGILCLSIARRILS